MITAITNLASAGRTSGGGASGLGGRLRCWVGPWKVSRHMDEDRHKTQALYISAPGQSVTTYFRYLSFGACFNKCQLIWLYKGREQAAAVFGGGGRGRLFEGRLMSKYKDSNLKTGALAPQYKEFYMKTGRHCLPVGQSRHVTGISY